MTSSILKRALACALATLFALTLLSVSSLLQGGQVMDEAHATEAQLTDYPEWALLPDGSPNPAFVYQDGSMITIDPDNLHSSGYVYSYIDADGNTVVVNEENAPDVISPGLPVQPNEGVEFHGENEPGEPGAFGENDGYLNLNTMSLFAANASVSTFSKPFDRFFSLNNGVALFGSGSAWRHYFVPAYSDVPLVSLCLQKGLRNPGDDTPTAGVERGADSWMINLASWAPSILRSYGLAMGADDNANKTLVAYVQSAVWVRQGSLSASDGGLLDALVASTNIPAVSSNPHVSGIPADGLSLPSDVKVNGVRYGQHGPFTYSGGSSPAAVNIYYGDPAKNIPVPGAFTGDADGNVISATLANGTEFYIYLPRQASDAENIYVRISSSYSTIVPARAFTVSGGQDQLVIPQWDAVSGERVFWIQLNDLEIKEPAGLLSLLKEKEDPDDFGGLPTYAKLPMEGAVFHLYAAEDILTRDEDKTLVYAKDTLVGTLTTDQDGKASLDNIPIGKYILKEYDVQDADKTLIGGALRSKYHFVRDTEIEFTVQDPEVFVVTNSQTLTNIYRLGKIVIEKVGARANEPLEGAVFEVSATRDILDPLTGDKVWSAGDVVGTITTDIDGLASLKDVLPGDYVLRETFAPDGYLPAPDKYFTIANRTGAEEFEFYTWRIVDQLPGTYTPAKTSDDFLFASWILIFAIAAGAVFILRRLAHTG